MPTPVLKIFLRNQKNPTDYRLGCHQQCVNNDNLILWTKLEKIVLAVRVAGSRSDQLCCLLQSRTGSRMLHRRLPALRNDSAEIKDLSSYQYRMNRLRAMQSQVPMTRTVLTTTQQVSSKKQYLATYILYKLQVIRDHIYCCPCWKVFLSYCSIYPYS